ncbi:MAG: gliding motility-associated C-terminal domain-containing protein [Bacteroidales bacterium]|nr:gliding motility-associated C-terminal domain-containing protein [Bacteroidales bacterium]
MRLFGVLNLIILQTLLLSGLKAQADFTASVTEGCTPLSVKFSVDPATINVDTVSYITWNFGIGDTINSLDPDTVTYLRDGEYTVTMMINGDRDNAVVKERYIIVHRTLRSVFRYEEYAPGNNFRFIPMDEITDTAATYLYLWRYQKTTGTDNRDNSYTVNIENQEIAIDTITLDTGIYRVSLNISDSYGCSSTSGSTVKVFNELIVPNLFMPEYDGLFEINPQNINTILKFQVFNRNGLVVFEQIAPVIQWDGRTNRGIDLNTGVFFYILESTVGDPAEKYIQNGFIHLYRNK